MRLPVTLAALVVAGRAAAAVPPPALTADRLPVTRHVLDNGMVVLLLPDRSVPAVTFWQVFRVGSRNERPGITGISHFFEHMMFNGSGKVPPKEYDRIIEGAGGSSNAFTDLDVTAYHEDIASDGLDVILDLDADRMASLSLLPEVLKSEIEVVKEERRVGSDNDVWGLLNEHLYAAAFQASPYRTPTVGFMKDLERITRDEMVAYFRIHYAPNNAVVVLAGDFEPGAALEAIRTRFGPLPRQPAAPEPTDAEPAQRGERRVAVHYPAETISLQVGYKAPACGDADAPLVRLLARILADGPSSRLPRALVHEQGIALDASASYELRLLPDLLQIYVELQPGRSFEDGLRALDAEIERLRTHGPTARELALAQNGAEAALVRSLQTNNGAGAQIGIHEVLFGDWRAMFDLVARQRAATTDDLRRVARTVLDPRRRTIAHVVPEEEDAAEGDVVTDGEATTP